MSLELRSVTAGYGDTTVLRDVDLVVPSGRIVALIGSNGAGKTTLLRVASGLIRPSAGSVEIEGHDVATRRPEQRVALGLCHVPEGSSIFPSLTVRENLRLFDGRTNGDPVERAADAFPILGQRANQVAGTMSGGEQRMLALARAYLTRPKYVLLDEVSMGLAPLIVEEIFAFLNRLAANGSALLVVEQFVQQVLAIADLTYVLRKGTVTFAGEPAELDADQLAAEYLGVRT